MFEMGAKFDDGWSVEKDEKKNVSKKITEPKKHQLYFAKEKRRGKTVTIVKPFYIDKKELQSVLKTIKKKLGTGGTLKEDSLEFQGELKDKLKPILESLEFRFK